MKIHEAIRRARERLGISQSELARRVGVSKTAVGKWEDGSTAPNRRRARQVALALGLPPSAIDAPWGLELQPTEDNLGTHICPVWPWSAYASAAQGEEIDVAGFSQVVVSVREHEKPVALMIESDPMPGIVRPGDIVVVVQSPLAQRGDLVVAEAGDDIVLRRYEPRGQDSAGQDAYDLTSTNPDLATITVNSSNPGRVLGVVIEIRRRLRS